MIEKSNISYNGMKKGDRAKYKERGCTILHFFVSGVVTIQFDDKTTTAVEWGELSPELSKEPVMHRSGAKKHFHRGDV